MKRTEPLFTIAWMIVLFSTATVAQHILYRSPVPGSTFVSPTTNIILRCSVPVDSKSVSQPTSIIAEGDRSGIHQGAIELTDDECTMLFYPDTPFAYDESVRIHIGVGLRTRGGKEIPSEHFSFRTAPKLRAALVNEQAATMPKTEPTRTMGALIAVRDDNLPPDFPRFDILVDNDPAPGSIFLSMVWRFPPQPPAPKLYVLILDQHGKPRFYRESFMAYDFKLQPEKNWLTYFDRSRSRHYALDSLGALVDSFSCGNGFPTDPHDLIVRRNGSALFFGNDHRIMDLSGVVPGGEKAASVSGTVIQEIDARKRVVFEWRAFDHVPLTDAIHEDLRTAAIEYTHANSLEVDRDGNLLVCFRHLDQIMKINRTTGEIMWRFGGKRNQFTFLNDSLGFHYQHDARRLANGNISLLDNGNFRSPPYSRALEYRLDEQAMTATLVWQYRHKPDLFGFAMGNVQRLPNGNTMIGWGSTTPTLTEVKPDGSTAFELRFANANYMSYRALRYEFRETLQTSVEENHRNISLDQNYPNPILSSQGQSETIIPFELDARKHVTLEVFDVLGRKISTLVDEVRDAGRHEILFNVSPLRGGNYFYHLRAAGFSRLRMMHIQ